MFSPPKWEIAKLCCCCSMDTWSLPPCLPPGFLFLGLQGEEGRPSPNCSEQIHLLPLGSTETAGCLTSHLPLSPSPLGPQPQSPPRDHTEALPRQPRQCTSPPTRDVQSARSQQRGLTSLEQGKGRNRERIPIYCSTQAFLTPT